MPGLFNNNSPVVDTAQEETSVVVNNSQGGGVFSGGQGAFSDSQNPTVIVEDSSATGPFGPSGTSALPVIDQTPPQLAEGQSYGPFGGGGANNVTTEISRGPAGQRGPEGPEGPMGLMGLGVTGVRMSADQSNTGGGVRIEFLVGSDVVGTVVVPRGPAGTNGGAGERGASVADVMMVNTPAPGEDTVLQFVDSDGMNIGGQITVQAGIQGMQGERGLQGPQGIQGNRGDQGIQGPRGFTGPPGTNGMDGAQGRSVNAVQVIQTGTPVRPTIIQFLDAMGSSIGGQISISPGPQGRDGSGTGGTAIQVNGTNITDPDFVNSGDVSFSVDSDGEITLTVANAIARVTDIATWARTTNTDTIPVNKIPSSVLMTGSVEDFALTGNPATVPDTKINPTIARVTQLAQFIDNGTARGDIANIAYDATAGSITVTNTQGQATVIDLEANDVREWTDGTTYNINDLVFIVGTGLFVRRNISGASDPRTDTTNWNFIERNNDSTETINQVAPDTNNNISLIGGQNITITPNANNSTITIDATDNISTETINNIVPDATNNITLEAGPGILINPIQSRNAIEIRATGVAPVTPTNPTLTGPNRRNFLSADALTFNINVNDFPARDVTPITSIMLGTTVIAIPASGLSIVIPASMFDNTGTQRLTVMYVDTTGTSHTLSHSIANFQPVLMDTDTIAMFPDLTVPPFTDLNVPISDGLEITFRGTETNAFAAYPSSVNVTWNIRLGNVTPSGTTTVMLQGVEYRIDRFDGLSGTFRITAEI